MVTLLVLLYKSTGGIPDEFSDFYDNLFHTLLVRHDRSKPGYSRKRMCDIGEKPLRNIFERFCFEFSKDDSVTFSIDDGNSIAEKVISEAGIEGITSDDFFYDLTKVACLILLEGFEYQYIHKSVREYYAASYVKRQSEEFAQKFYDRVSDLGYIWRQELKFLSEIDQLRYKRYYLKPKLEAVLGEYEVNYNDPETVGELASVFNFCDSINVMISDEGAVGMVSHIVEDDILTGDYSIFGRLARKIIFHLRDVDKDVVISKYCLGEFERDRMMRYIVPLQRIIQDENLLSEFQEEFALGVVKLLDWYRETCDDIKRDNENLNIIDF